MAIWNQTASRRDSAWLPSAAIKATTLVTRVVTTAI